MLVSSIYCGSCDQREDYYAMNGKDASAPSLVSLASLLAHVLGIGGQVASADHGQTKQKC